MDGDRASRSTAECIDQQLFTQKGEVWIYNLHVSILRCMASVAEVFYKIGGDDLVT